MGEPSRCCSCTVVPAKASTSGSRCVYTYNTPCRPVCFQSKDDSIAAQRAMKILSMEEGGIRFALQAEWQQETLLSAKLLTRSLPSRLNVACGFSSIWKTMSAASRPGCSSPFSAKVICNAQRQLQTALEVHIPPCPNMRQTMLSSG
jgi:hypothetical protein